MDSTINLLTIDNEYRSACRLGIPTDTYYDTPPQNSIVIRWGNSEIYGDRDFQKVINSSEAIKLNCDKRLALIQLNRVVTTPTIFDKEIPKGVIGVVRPYTHSSGYGFCTRLGPHKIPEDYYSTEFIKTTKEVRVWFAGDKTLCGRRVNVLKLPESEFQCRSEWGYSFWEKTPKRLHNDTIKAAKQIGLELGAADVLIKNGKYYFLELNSAPTVDSKHIRRFYQKNIPRVIKQKFNINYDIKIT